MQLIYFCLIILLINSPLRVAIAETKAFQDTLQNGDPGPVMIAIRPGHFPMGDNFKVGKSYEQPVHIVHINYAFAISKFPVSFEEYDKFSQATNTKQADQYKWPRTNHPVFNVNQADAKRYARWLSEQTNQHYRLPSEAEWEYAARAGSLTQYPWGNEIGLNNAHCAGCGNASKKNQTASIGRYPANAWGIHGMIGNIWEMTADCWNYDYNNAPSDGSAWRSGDCMRLVLRGGSWGDVPSDLRSSARLRSYAKARTVNIGFRLVRENSFE